MFQRPSALCFSFFLFQLLHPPKELSGRDNVSKNRNVIPGRALIKYISAEALDLLPTTLLAFGHRQVNLQIPLTIS
uniref:Putative secreted protein n=1 Tax=Panstrongylus lignarius TaxID=156445 RepID=A0A224XX39_9HEMI